MIRVVCFFVKMHFIEKKKHQHSRNTTHDPAKTGGFSLFDSAPMLNPILKNKRKQTVD